MASDERDNLKEYLSLIVETSMNRAIKPLTDELAQHSLQLQELHQFTFGVTGNNGIRSEMEKAKRDIQSIKDEAIDIEEFRVVKSDISEIKTAQTRMYAYASSTAGFISLSFALFGDKFKKMFGL